MTAETKMTVDEYGARRWTKGGLLHREGGLPAVEHANGGKEYWREGKHHRIGGPCMECANGYRMWCVDGELHRTDGPAIDNVLVTGCERKWFVDGRKHRTDGPAVESASGEDEFWIQDVQQPHVLLDNWRAVALGLYMTAGAAPVGLKRGKAADDAMEEKLNADLVDLSRAFRLAGISRWGEEARAILNAHFTAKKSDAAERAPDAALRAKCARIGFLCATGNFAAIPVAEREAILRLIPANKALPRLRFLRAGNDTPDPPLRPTPLNGLTREIPRLEIPAYLSEMILAALSPAAHACEGPVEFAHAWRRRLRSGALAPQRHMAVAAAPIDRIDASEAPVFATLSTPEGGTIDLRRIDGAVFRPILAPGCWRPATEAEFRAAARDGAAWRDCPFDAPPPPDRSAMALDEYCTPSDVPGGADEADSARERIVAAGRLVVAAGIVHRRTVEPTLAVVRTEATTGLWGTGLNRNLVAVDQRYEVVWRLDGDMAFTDTQSIIASAADRYARWSSPSFEADRRGGSSSRANRPEIGLGFPITAMAEAATVGRCLARSSGYSFHEAVPVVALSGGEDYDLAGLFAGIRLHAGSSSGGHFSRDVAISVAKEGLRDFKSWGADDMERAAEKLADVAEAYAETSARESDDQLVAFATAAAESLREKARTLTVNDDSQILSGFGRS
jgi:hypothetical protein